ncbi:hypothetical protein KY289_030693 [Solanum tuberosum]|nr:hypothetical protein KY289_030693 [Solanum tuberosum]
MTSSSKSPEETEILTSSDTSLVIVRKESPPDDIWVFVDGIARIMLINDSRSLPEDEEVHFQDLPLVLLPDAPSEGEVREHASFRVALDGFTNWSSVSQNLFLLISTDSFPMAHAFDPVPLNVDNTDEIPLAEVFRKKRSLKLGKNIVKFRLNSYLPWQLEKELVLLLAIHSKSLPLFFLMMILGRVVTGFGVPEMAVLLTKLESQGWSSLFFQGNTQRKLAKQEVTEFYINSKSNGQSFTSTVRNTPLHLVPADVARILGIPSEGWDHYVKLEWPALPNHSSSLAISRKFSSKPNLTHHRCVEKNVMSPLHQLFFDDKNGHALPHGFWMASIFEAFDVPLQVWHSQTVKDVVGQVNHMDLPASMRRLDIPLQCLQNQLDEKENELDAMANAHQMEKENWEARVVTLQNELAQERTANIVDGYSNSHLSPLNSSFLLVSMIHSVIFVLLAMCVLSL